MDHEVGVASYGGGEVGVVGEGETVVADVVGGVEGFGHGADGDAVDHILFAPAGNLLEEVVVGVGECFAGAYLHLEAQLGYKFDEGVEFFGVGLVVDAIDERLGMVAGGAYVFCHLAVGEEHELLDEPVGLFLLFDINSDGFGVFVELELHLLALKVDGAGGVAAVAEDGCEVV